MKNPSLIVKFLTIYNEDEITKVINNEVLELVYYSKLTYDDIVLKMSYFDRKFWINGIKKILSAQAKIANPDIGSFDDEDTFGKLSSSLANGKS